VKPTIFSSRRLVASSATKRSIVVIAKPISTGPAQGSAASIFAASKTKKVTDGK
jgi:hypothetical protein